MYDTARNRRILDTRHDNKFRHTFYLPHSRCFHNHFIKEDESLEVGASKHHCRYYLFYTLCGVFLLLSIGLTVILRLFLEKEKSYRNWIIHLFCSSLGWILFITICARNFLLAGDIKGGNAKVVSKSIGSILKITFLSFVDLLGGVSGKSLHSPRVVAVLSLLALLVLVIAAVYSIYAFIALHHRVRLHDKDRLRSVYYIGLYCVLYTLGMMWLGKNTMITYGPRYFLTIIPEVICLFILILSFSSLRDEKLNIFGLRPRDLFVCFSIVIIISTQLISYPHRLEAWNDSNNNKYAINASYWINKNARPDDVIMIIGNGQTIGYYSQRKTLVIPSHQFSSFEWGENQIREAVEFYNVKKIIALASDTQNGYSDFAVGLMKGIVPNWLEQDRTFSEACAYSPR